MRKTWKVLTFTALMCLCLGIAAACSGGEADNSAETELTAENVVIVLETGAPESSVGKTGDVCLVAESGRLYRKTVSGWEKADYKNYNANGSTLTVTYSDGTTDSYAMATSEEGECAHEFGDMIPVYEPLCVVPGIGVQTCTICHESFPVIIPANGNHVYEPGDANCVLCGGAPNYFYAAVDDEPQSPTPWAPEGYYLIHNVPEAALQDGKIEVPGEIKGLPVVIGSDAFTDAEKAALTNVVLDEGIVGIEANAFEDCENMTSLQLPETLEFIGESAFAETGALAIGLEIPSNVKTIGYGAFQGSGITSVYIPASVSSLGADWTAEDVQNNTATSKFNIDALQWAAQTADFGEAGRFIAGTITPKLVGQVFANTSLTKVEFEAGSDLKIIPHGCFYGCENLTEVVLPDGVEVIGEGAFSKCNLRSVDLPDSVTTVLNGAFIDNEHLNHFGIGAGVKELGHPIGVSDEALMECFPALNSTYLMLFKNMLPNYKENLNPALFENCYRLVEIENRSSNITVALDSAENPGGIGKYARILSVTGTGTFSEQSAEEGSYTVYTAEDGKAYVVDFLPVDSDARITLDFSQIEGEIAIHDYAFYHDEDNADSTITSINFGTDITSIGAHTFENCIGFTTVDLFECKNLTSIGDYAFFVDFDVEKQGTKLTTVKIGDGVETIGDCVFMYQSSLATVYIGNCTKNNVGDTNHIKSFGKDVFFSCQKIQYVYFAGTYQHWLDCGGSTHLFMGHNTGAIPSLTIELKCSDKTERFTQS